MGMKMEGIHRTTELETNPTFCCPCRDVQKGAATVGWYMIPAARRGGQQGLAPVSVALCAVVYPSSVKQYFLPILEYRLPSTGPLLSSACPES